MSDSKSRQERIEAVAGPHDYPNGCASLRVGNACDCRRGKRLAAITKLVEDVEREALERAAKWHDEQYNAIRSTMAEAVKAKDEEIARQANEIKFKDSLIWTSRESELYKATVAAEKRAKAAEAKLAQARRDGAREEEIAELREAAQLVANSLGDVETIGWGRSVDPKRWAADNRETLLSALRALHFPEGGE